jgi:hypothetical protein
MASILCPFKAASTHRALFIVIKNKMVSKQYRHVLMFLAHTVLTDLNALSVSDANYPGMVLGNNLGKTVLT